MKKKTPCVSIESIVRLICCRAQGRKAVFESTCVLLRWLNTVIHKMENSRFGLVFLNCYFLMSNKEYRTDVKLRPKGSNLFTEATQLSLLW